MGDAFPPPLHAPALAAAAPSPASTAAPTPQLRRPRQIVTARLLPFPRDSNRTRRYALPPVKQLAKRVMWPSGTLRLKIADYAEHSRWVYLLFHCAAARCATCQPFSLVRRLAGEDLS